MDKAILLRDLLQLMPTHTEIVIRDEHYTLLFVGTKYDENIHKYEYKLVLELDTWSNTKLLVRIINENWIKTFIRTCR